MTTVIIRGDARASFPGSKVRVVRLYEIQCEECGNPGAEFFDSRVEADDARRDHLALHRRPIERAT